MLIICCLLISIQPDKYALGSPMVKSAEIEMGVGKVLSIKVENQSPENVYVKEVILNGKKMETPFLKHSDLIGGGELWVEMK